MWNMMSSLFWWPFAATSMLIALIIGVLFLIFWIWMIIDCVKRDFRNDVEKIVWIVIIVLATWIGSLLYYIIIRALNPKGIVRHTR